LTYIVLCFIVAHTTGMPQLNADVFKPCSKALWRRKSYQLAECWERWKCECRWTELVSCEISCSNSGDDKVIW